MIRKLSEWLDLPAQARTFRDQLIQIVVFGPPLALIATLVAYVTLRVLGVEL